MLKSVVAGVDVSASKLDVAALFAEGGRQVASFDNDPDGHRQLCRWLTKGGRSARVVVESTGIYSLDLALALHGSPGIEVMVANPRALKDFSRASMRRSKSDTVDAESTLEFALRMDFVPWAPPSSELLELRAISRRIQSLTVERSREKNRLHAARATREISHIIENDIEVNIRHLTRRIDRLAQQALVLVEASPKLERVFRRVTSVRGIAAKSAVQLLPELLVLPKSMTARQWVAHAGLDPRIYQSGTSVERPTRISKVGNRAIRRALYMPSLVASRREPHVRAYYEELIARGKKPRQALVAVMRKLLHAIYGMVRNDEDFVGEKFRRLKTA